jgi:hypothetical protein
MKQVSLLWAVFQIDIASYKSFTGSNHIYSIIMYFKNFSRPKRAYLGQFWFHSFRQEL